MMNPVDDAIAIWKAGVAAVEPGKLVRDHLIGKGGWITSPELSQNLLIVGAGKAGAAMAASVEAAFSGTRHCVSGIVNVPEGLQQLTQWITLNEARPAGSNLPTNDGVRGSEQMLSLLSSASADDIAICLLSGGGSALLPLPVIGITLEDKLMLTQMLHHSGATIDEMNCVRKHLSRIKGGRLAKAFTGKFIISLIISDVIDNRLDTIASGPTSPDPTTYADAVDVLRRYNLLQRVPRSVFQYLTEGIQGLHPETPKSVLNVVNSVIGSNESALDAAQIRARRLGYRSDWVASGLAGESATVARKMVNKIVIQDHRNAIIFGGETTVTLGPNPGKGGRNQEFVLAMLCELGLDGMKGVTILSGGTDGEDGPTDAAGAIGTEETLKRARALNLDPNDFLKRHDAYHFFEATGGLFKTGLTGTNVMDLGVILLD